QSAQNCLLAHQVRFDLRNERRTQYPGSVSTGTHAVGFRLGEAFALRVVFRMDSDECRYAETAQIFRPYLRTGAFRSDHDDRNVLADLLAFFDVIEAV